MRTWLSRLGSAALALLLAGIVWVVAVQQDYPRREFSQPVTVSRSGLPEDLTVFGDILNEVRIEVRAPKARWDNLQSKDFTAWVDLSSLSAGEYDVPVQVLPPDPQVQVTAIDPPVIRVRLEARIGKSLPVQVNIMDAPAYGYSWTTPVITPTHVLVSGSASWMEQISSAVVEVYLGGARTSVARTPRVEARDIQGNTVGAADIAPRTVSVTIPVTQLPGYRELTILVEPSGTPADGYTVSSVLAEPKLVSVQGDPLVISSLSGYITVPVDISGASQDVVEQVPLRLPESVSTLGAQSAEVVVRIVPITGALTVQRRPVIQGLGAGLVYTLTLDLVNVFLTGPSPKLLALRPDAVPVVLDVTGLGPGVHVVEPKVLAPSDIKVESVSPQTVEITIGLSLTPAASTPERATRGTPTASVTPTAKTVRP